MDTADVCDDLVPTAPSNYGFGRVRHGRNLRSSLAIVNAIASDDRDETICEFREDAPMDDKPFRPAWILARLKETGKKQTQLVRFMNDRGYDIDTTKISKSLNNKRELSLDEISLIGEFFGFTRNDTLYAYMNADTDAGAALLRDREQRPIQSDPQPNAGLPERVNFNSNPLPIMGKSIGGGPEERVLFNGQRLGEIDRPKRLAQVHDAYATFVHGSSMEPRYEAGEVVLVNPQKPLRRNCYVVAQVYDNDSDPPYGYIKKFISYDRNLLTLEQLNPPEGEGKVITFPRERVVSVHRIVGTLDE